MRRRDSTGREIKSNREWREETQALRAHVERFKRLVLLALIVIMAVLVLTGCKRENEPTFLVCTVDDDISFVAEDVVWFGVDPGGVLRVHTDGRLRIVRDMLPGETCQLAWSVVYDDALSEPNPGRDSYPKEVTP